MDAKELLKELQNAQGKQAEEAVTAKCKALTKEEKKCLEDHILNVAAEEMKKADEVLEQARLFIEMRKISKYLSLSVVATDYFGKSSSWLYHRIHGTEIHGKPVSFTQEEREILATALKDIAHRLTETSLRIA